MWKEIENPVLVVGEGDGHTSFVLGGETSDDILGDLVDGEVFEGGGWRGRRMEL